MISNGVPENYATAHDFIMVRAQLVQHLGGTNRAMLWTRIDWRCAEAGPNRVEDPAGRWYRAGIRQLAAETGITDKAVRTALDYLVSTGELEVAPHMLGGAYDQIRSYRPVRLAPWQDASPDLGKDVRETPQSPLWADEQSPIWADVSTSRDVVETKNASSSPPTMQSPPKRRKFTPRESDDDTGSDSVEEPRVSDAAPRKVTQEAKDIAENRGTSGYGLALRFQRGRTSPGTLPVKPPGRPLTPVATPRRPGPGPARLRWTHRFR